MNDLNIAFIQTDVSWEETGKNLDLYSGIISSRIHFPVDIIFLPEMFNTGFSINPEKTAETMDGRSLRFLREIAKSRNCVLMTSLLIAEDNHWFNRQVTVFPDGTCNHSDKRHLFRLSEEYKLIHQGTSRIIDDVKGWNIFPLICYDLRFPVWSRNSFINNTYEYDLLVYHSNWPASRSYVWKSLLVARAIENLAYVVGVNRVGKDGFGTDHTGDSMVVDPKGNILVSAAFGKPDVCQFTLSLKDLQKVRKDYPFGPDWDHFKIQN